MAPSQHYAGNGAFSNLAAEYSAGTVPAPPCNTCYISDDALGNTRMVTDQTGTISASHDYFPFGSEVAGQTAGRTNAWGTTDNISQKYTGQERDTETGLDHFPARHFASEMGRFMVPDPAGNFVADPTNPQSWNMYGYALNSPLVYVDPTRLVTCYVDGFQTDCGTVQQVLGAGSVVQCPDNACTIATSTGFLFFRAYTSGISGYFGLNQQPIENPEGIPVDLGIDDLGCVSHIQPVSPSLTPTNPCTVAGRAPSPAQYANRGKAGSANPFKNIANLLQFKRGGELDAQVRYGGAPSYANYVFGVYMAAAGYTIGAALNVANGYAVARSRYPSGTPMAGPLWTSTPQVNVLNIANGFNAQRTGATCHQ